MVSFHGTFFMSPPQHGTGPERLAHRILARHQERRAPFLGQTGFWHTALWHTDGCVRSLNPDDFDPDDLDPGYRYPSSDAADYGADDIEQHFVELTETGSASEASALAAKLRRAGIIALANARPYPLARGSRGRIRQDMRTFVMVFASELDRAAEILDDELGEEGEVPIADIKQEMQDAQDDPDSAMAWYYQDKENAQRQGQYWRLLGLLGLVVGAVWYFAS
ncbi:MAG: hypothetical protein ACI89X_004601 [Planctomycetota bacterium]